MFDVGDKDEERKTRASDEELRVEARDRNNVPTLLN